MVKLREVSDSGVVFIFRQEGEKDGQNLESEIFLESIILRDVEIFKRGVQLR